MSQARGCTAHRRVEPHAGGRLSRLAAARATRCGGRSAPNRSRTGATSSRAVPESERSSTCRSTTQSATRAARLSSQCTNSCSHSAPVVVVVVEHGRQARTTASAARDPPGCVVRLLRVEIHPSPLKHGAPVEDIEHAVRNAMVSDELDDDLPLYLGPSRSGSLVEVLVVVRGSGRAELAIHAMPMREKY